MFTILLSILSIIEFPLIKSEDDTLDVCPSACQCLNTTVYCENRFIQSIPKILSNKTTHLYLDTNFISTIKRYDFSNVTNLKVLGLSSNTIASISFGAFENLTRLTHLILSDNKLRYITKEIFIGLTNLTYLALTTVTPTDKSLCISDHAFNDLKNLQTLKLDRNGIKYISDKTFVGLKKLKILDLSQNDLALISANAFQDSPSLSLSLDVTGKIPCCCSTLQALKSISVASGTCYDQTTKEVNLIHNQECTGDVIADCNITMASTCEEIDSSFTYLSASNTMTSLSAIGTTPIYLGALQTSLSPSATTTSRNSIQATQSLTINVIEHSIDIPVLRTSLSVIYNTSVKTSGIIPAVPVLYSSLTTSIISHLPTPHITATASQQQILLATEDSSTVKQTHSQNAVLGQSQGIHSSSVLLLQKPTAAAIKDAGTGLSLPLVLVFGIGGTFIILFLVLLLFGIRRSQRGRSFWPWKNTTLPPSSDK